MKFIALSMMALLSCSKQGAQGLRAYTPSFIHKSAENEQMSAMEATAFEWNGELLTMISFRDVGRIDIRSGTTTITSFETKIQYACAFVDGSVLHVFGSSGDELFEQHSSNLTDWSAPALVRGKKEGMHLFNSSVAKTPDGYVMAYETCEPGTVCFNVRFMKSTDLIHWQDVGDIMSPDRYAACPTIRYVDGSYYVFVLRDVGGFATFVLKSDDLINWTESEKIVLSFLGEPDEGIDNSDMDLVEHDGKVVINYAVGDQDKWANVKYATYDGSLEQFVKEFF